MINYYVNIVFSFIKENFAILKWFTIVDPLLLPLLVGSCKIEDLDPEALSLIPAYLSAALLLKVVTESGLHLSLNEVYLTSY